MPPWAVATLLFRRGQIEVSRHQPQVVGDLLTDILKLQVARQHIIDGRLTVADGYAEMQRRMSLRIESSCTVIFADLLVRADAADTFQQLEHRLAREQDAVRTIFERVMGRG